MKKKAEEKKETVEESRTAAPGFSEQLVKLQNVTNRLSKAATFDALCLQAVELGRSQLEFDRLGLWFRTPDPLTIVGSFGTDENGQIRDERNQRLTISPQDPIWNALSYQESVLHFRNVPLSNDRGEVIGLGEKTFAPLWNGDVVIGVLGADNLLTQRPYTDQQIEIHRLYATTLGYLCTRKQTETALEESRARLAEAQRIAHLGNWELTFAPPTVFWSEEVYRIFGVDPQTFQPSLEAFLDRIHPEDQERMQSIFQNLLTNAGSHSYDHRILRSNGEERVVNEQVVVHLDEQGAPVRFVGVVFDITDRKRLEAQLLEAQKLEGIGRLAGGIAHDFNNLLTVILGYTEMALMGLPENAPLGGDLQQVKKAADRAADLTRQLLAFARRQIIEPKVLSLNTLILELDKLLRRLIGEDIDLITLPAPDLWNVKVDAGQFEQVLINLCVNARDAMRQGGMLTIETANVVLDTEYARHHPDVLPGSYVMLAVSDTGIGMDVAMQQHIFEPFFTTKETGKGTGLGLATCHGIVKQSGGHIWLYSEPGQGTTFKIYLPRVLEAASPTLPEEEVTIPQGTETILLVEDEVMVRMYAAEALRGQGYTVLEADGGAEALTLAAGYVGTIHLLLTDVVMPQMSGRQLAEQLATLRPKIKILYASGYTDNTIVHHGILEAGVAFVQKPYAPDTLARKVRETLDSAL